MNPPCPPFECAHMWYVLLNIIILYIFNPFLGINIWRWMKCCYLMCFGFSHAELYLSERV